MKLELDLKNRETPPAKPFIEERQVLELKALSSYPLFVFLGPNNTRPIIIATDLNEGYVEVLASVLSPLGRLSQT